MITFAGVIFYANLLVDISFMVDLGLQPFMGCGAAALLESTCYKHCFHGPSLDTQTGRCHMQLSPWKSILTTVARRYWDEEHDIWVMDLPAIRARYLRSWAAVDAMAAMPWDVIAVVAQDSWIGRLQVRRWRKCLHTCL